MRPVWACVTSFSAARRKSDSEATSAADSRNAVCKRSAGLLGIRMALRQRFLRELRGQVPRELFESGRQPSRQVPLQRFRRGGLRRAIEAGGFFADFLQRRGHFSRKDVAVGRNLLLPMFGGNTMFGGNGLRPSFARGGINLLPRIGEQARDLASELH